MDMILVGDSLGMVVLGYQGTVPVMMEDCISHCQAVRRGATKTFPDGAQWRIEISGVEHPSTMETMINEGQGKAT